MCSKVPHWKMPAHCLMARKHACCLTGGNKEVCGSAWAVCAQMEKVHWRQKGGQDKAFTGEEESQPACLKESCHHPIGVRPARTCLSTRE